MKEINEKEKQTSVNNEATDDNSKTSCRGEKLVQKSNEKESSRGIKDLSKNNEETKDKKDKDAKESKNDSKANNRIKDYLGCLLFLAILFGMLKGSSIWLDRKVADNRGMLTSRLQNIKNIQHEENEKIDVVVLGDSLTYSCLSPLEIWKDKGYTSYICAQPGQIIQESYYMLKTTLKTQKPKLVVLETNPVFKTGGTLDSMQDMIAEFENETFKVMRYHDAWKSMMFSDKKYNVYENKGYIIRNGSNDYKSFDYMQESNNEAKVKPVNLLYLNMIKDMCKDNGIEFALLTVPSQKATFGSTASKYEEYNAMNDYAKKNGIKYLNMNLDGAKKIGIDWSCDCVDGGEHLNLNGAMKVTKHFGQFLSDEYNLADHRNEQKYADWNTSYDNYKTSLSVASKQLDDLLAKKNKKSANADKLAEPNKEDLDLEQDIAPIEPDFIGDDDAEKVIQKPQHQKEKLNPKPAPANKKKK